MEQTKNTFNELYKINVNEHVEKKNTGKAQLSYLSWTYAWKEVKSRFPDASYEIVKFENGLPYCYDENTGYMVYTRVTIEGITHEMWLPVMDSHNDAMLNHSYEVKTKYSSYTVDKCTMFDVNKTIMRCLTKNLAMFGLGLYIYSGEDLPSELPPQPLTPEQEAEIQKLTVILEDWINSGALEGKGLEKAQFYIKTKDLDGINRTIQWCNDNKQAS
jgi:hypothetical protein